MQKKSQTYLKSVFRSTPEKSYMVSLQNSQEFLGVLRRYGRLMTRILFEKSKVSNRLQLITRFGEMLLRLNREHGSAFVVKYLKACTVALQRFIGGQPLKSMREIEPDMPLPGLTKSGLPKFIPSRDRRELGKLTVRVVRWYLTMFSVYRIISCPGKLKLSTITDPFTGQLGSLKLINTWLESYASRFVDLKFKSRELTASLGLERIQKASPSSSISWMGVFEDVWSWEGRPEFYNYANWSDNFSLYYDWFTIRKSGLISNVKSGVKAYDCLGQLALKEEAAGKIRVFAMVDVWTQTVLKPLHDLLFKLFKHLPNDATHDQDTAFKRAMSKSQEYGKAFCYDLSAATDRLPVSSQVAILNSLFKDRKPVEDVGGTFGSAWAELLVNREYRLPKAPRLGIDKDLYLRYSVGQPMGALSSWAMLNLTHHMILQMINYYLYRQVKWYVNYEVLGDDIVIFNKQVADLYLDVMENHLGVKCNASKSLLAPDRPVVEFAKRVSIGAFEVSAFSWRQFRSLDSLMGRAAIAVDLLTRKIQSHPMRALKALTGRSWSNVDSYLYTLLNFCSVIVMRKAMNLEVLCDYLIDLKNPFRFIGGRIIGNLKPGPLEDVILRFVKGLPIQVPKISPKVDWYSRLFEAFSRGYLTDRIVELVYEMTQRSWLNDNIVATCNCFDPPAPIELVEQLFYWGHHRVIVRPGRFEHLPISELLVMYDEWMQLKRDFQFWKFRVDRKNRLDNPLKLLEFLEKAKKYGVISVEIKR